MPQNKKEYDREYYARNKEKRRAQIQARNKEHVARNRLWLKSYLSDKYCLDCNNSDWRVLQFDHQFNKKYEIGTLIANSGSLEKLQAEISKCEIVCANCHIIRTGIARGTWRFAGFA